MIFQLRYWVGWDIEGYRGDGKGRVIRKRLIYVWIKYVMWGKNGNKFSCIFNLSCQIRGVSEFISGYGLVISNSVEIKLYNVLLFIRLFS